jgi:EEF1A N-terminal glycine/lysine methyltransferase
MPGSSDIDGDSDAVNLFQEPDGFYEPEKPATTTTYTLNDGRLISLQLVGHSPLWVRDDVICR